MPEVQVAVGAVVVHDDRLLLVRRGSGPGAGRWSVPGGRVRLGETMHEAVVREVAEETGLDVVVGEFLGWVERIGPPGADPPEYHYVILDFAASPLDPGQPVRAGDDAAGAAWVDLGDLGDLDLVDGLVEFLRDVGVLGAPRPWTLS